MFLRGNRISGVLIKGKQTLSTANCKVPVDVLHVVPVKLRLVKVFQSRLSWSVIPKVFRLSSVFNVPLSELETHYFITPLLFLLMRLMSRSRTAAQLRRRRPTDLRRSPEPSGSSCLESRARRGGGVKVRRSKAVETTQTPKITTVIRSFLLSNISIESVCHLCDLS